MFLSFPCSFNMHAHFLLLFSVCSYITPLVCCAADDFTVQGTCVCIRCDQHFYEFIMLICVFCLTLKRNHISYSHVAAYLIQFSEHASEEMDQAKRVKGLFLGFSCTLVSVCSRSLPSSVFQMVMEDGNGGLQTTMRSRSQRTPEYLWPCLTMTPCLCLPTLMLLQRNFPSRRARS